MSEMWKRMGEGLAGKHRPDRPRSRVGFWLGALLFFVPVFYFLLFMKPFSIRARMGWGLWLALIVFVKASGLSEPILDLGAIEEEMRQAESTGREESGPVPPPEPPLPEQPFPEPLPTLEKYLSRLEGGVLGIIVESFAEESPAALTVRFRREDDYFDSERALAQAALATSFALFYGRDFRAARLEFDYRGAPVQFALERSAFNRFFGLSEAEMRGLAGDGGKFAASAVKNLDGNGLDAFFRQFGKYKRR